MTNRTNYRVRIQMFRGRATKVVLENATFDEAKAEADLYDRGGVRCIVEKMPS